MNSTSANDTSTVRLLEPEWPVPPHVGACATTRLGGTSAPPFDSLNLGLHVGDEAERVTRNRALLADTLQLPAMPHWLNQVHGTAVQCVPGERLRDADAAFTDRPGEVLVVLTADCLPVLFSNAAGTAIAAAHAGWRGLAAGVLQNTLDHFDAGDTVHAWLAPAIGPTAFEVGSDVRDAFCDRQASNAAAFRAAGSPGKYLADLYALARRALQTHRFAPVHVYGGEYCAHDDPMHFFSHRRDQGSTGRQASLIWIKPQG